MAVVNYYNFKDGSGSTLTDKKGSANGTIAGATSPTWSANGYLSFSGGNGETAGDRQRVTFTRTTYEYSYNGSHSYNVVFRTTKSDANLHTLFTISQVGNAGESTISIDASELAYFFERTSVDLKYNTASSATTCNDGKWHIFTITYSTNAGIYYVDGVPLTTTSTGIVFNNFFQANAVASLASTYHSGTNYARDFTGDMCNFFNCNTKLSAANVIDIVNEFNNLI